MATNICDNERCTYHRIISDNDCGAPYIDVIEDGERVHVDRYPYRSIDGKRRIVLCDVCHAAVKMVLTTNA